MKSKNKLFHKPKNNRKTSSRNLIERDLIKQLITDNLNLQIIIRQKNFLRYFSRTSTTNQEKYSYHDLLKVIDQSPKNMISFFSSLIFNRVSIWMEKFISMPKEVASSISRFFENDYKLHFFAFVTFPSIFHHFTTKEFCDSAAQLVINMILNEPRYISNSFALSYLQSSTFCESLWYNFDFSNHKDDIYDRLIQSIKNSNSCLTKNQIKIITLLFEGSKTNFGRVIYGRFLLKSYLELHEGQEESPITKFLQAITVTVRSPQFSKIYETIINQTFFFEKDKLINFEKANRLTTVLSPSEIFTIQSLAQSAPEVFTYYKNDLQNLKVNDSYANDLTQLYFEVDLTSQFKFQSQKSIKISLFTDSNQNSISNESYESFVEYIIEQKTNHNIYLSLIEREKFSRSQMIKVFSKILVIDTQEKKPISSPTENWFSRLNKINFYPTLYPETNSPPNEKTKPMLESKVFKYSLHNSISKCQNKEAKLWIYLRSYAKCERVGIFTSEYTNFFTKLKHMRINYQENTNNSSFNNFFNSFLSYFSTYLLDDKINTIQISAFLGIVIKNASNHYKIPADQILLELLLNTQYKYLTEEIIWSSMMLQHVPEIKKLLHSNWDDGLSFIINLLHELVAKLTSDNINLKEGSLGQNESLSLVNNLAF